MLQSPVIGVIDDATRLVSGDGVAFHNPFNGGFAVDHVFVGFFRNARNGNLFVVNDAGLVIDVLGFAFAFIDGFLGETLYKVSGASALKKARFSPAAIPNRGKSAEVDFDETMRHL